MAAGDMPFPVPASVASEGEPITAKGTADPILNIWSDNQRRVMVGRYVNMQFEMPLISL